MSRPVRRFAPFLALSLALGASAIHARPEPAEPVEPTTIDAAPPIEVEAPRVVLRGVSTTLRIRATAPVEPPDLLVEIGTVPDGDVLARGALDDGAVDLEITLPSSGRATLEVRAPSRYTGSVEAGVRVIPGWWSLAPPFLAIVLALLFRQVVPSLLAGIWLGASIAHGDPLVGIPRTLDRYVVHALADPDHVSIIVFSLLLGGMVGIISRSGGTVGLVNALASKATTSERGQVVTWLLGIAVFFDDYANTLVVGNTMRPVTDRLRISREKLAYIVDSTAAPVAAIGIVTTWIGYEVSLIDGALREVGSDLDAYAVFLRSIPYNFYPVLALVFGLAVAVSRRDFGPMLTAERRASAGKLIRDDAVPLADFDNEALAPVPGKPHRWYNAVVPVAAVVGVTFVALWFTGRAAIGDAPSPPSSGVLGLVRAAGEIISNGNSFHALLYAAATGCVVALAMARAQRILSVPDGLHAWLNGMKSMLLAFVILTLAWAIADVCSDLDAAGFVAHALGGAVDPRLLPVLVFLFASLIAFSTGTSWATMGILIPLAVPASFAVARSAGLDPLATERVFMGSIAAVLSGAIFGDHCSPISDTTVLSSMSSGCDHIDHVRTQLPYALTVAGAAMLLGYLPEAFGLPAWACLVLGAVALAAVVRFAARPV